MSEKVRCGVLGCARVFERRMIPGFAAAWESAELVAVASRSADKARAMAEKHHISRAYGSYDALLADADIEAVYIPLPNDLHAEWTLKSLAAGKHVLNDKPGALTFADAKQMAEAAQTAQLRLMEGFMWRHHPQHARIEEIARSGEIGRVSHFRGVFAYLAAFDPANIRWHRGQGGGALLDTGVYPVNAARYHFDAEPVAVYAASLLDPVSGVDKYTSATLEFSDGRMGQALSGFDQAFISRYEVVGEKGSVTAERAFQVGDAGVNVIIRVGDDIRTETFPHVDQYGREIADFSAAVRDASRPLTPGEDGVAQARVMEALMRSSQEKRRVELSEIV